MPKSYSDEEKSYIKTRLKEEAGKCLAQYGIRKTTVDEIVKRVKIPKGTFYLFYQSKEQLLYEVILEQHEIIEEELLAKLTSISDSERTADKLTEILFYYYKLLDSFPALKLVNSDEFEILARKLPPNIIEEHLNHDDETIKKIAVSFPCRKDLDYSALKAAFLALYCSTLHKDQIGECDFEKALFLLIKGLVSQMM